MKTVRWVGSSLADLKNFPSPVRKDLGKAIYAAQRGEIDLAAKPLKGFAGTSVMEIVERYDTDTYRAVYTTKLADIVYVLHAFQKKSKSGIKTPKKDVDLIKARLKAARKEHKKRQN